MEKRQNFSFLAYCAASGLCGALSATCGKEAGNLTASPYIAAAMYTTMLAFNFLGLTLFSLALRRTASLQATAASVSANILASGLVGWIFYSEMLPTRWWLGLACLTVGTVLVQPQQQQKMEEKEYQRGRQRHPEVAYDGTEYNGFQLQNASSSSSSSSSSTTSPITSSASDQPQREGFKQKQQSKHSKNKLKTASHRQAPTIQGKLESALTKFLAIDRDELVLQGAGRTDAGVHARGQVVHFYSKRLLDDTDRAVRAVNSLLPEDIRLLSMLRVPLDYNVRFSLGKIYTYDLHLDPMGSDPFTHRYRLCPRNLLNNNKDKFDLEAFSAAAAVFVGTHDFSVFSSKPRDGSKRSPERTIRRCEIVSIPPQFDKSTSSSGSVNSNSNSFIGDPLLRTEIEGDGFLYKQVRHMIGAMLAVAAGRITCLDISKALADPIKKGGPEGRLSRPGGYILAEAHGLCLKHVFLPNPGDPDELMYGEQGPVLKRRAELASLLK